MKRRIKGTQIQITAHKLIAIVAGIFLLMVLSRWTYFVGGPKALALWTRIALDDETGSQLENARSALSYDLPPQQTLNFAYSSDSGRIRFLTNANLSKEWLDQNSGNENAEYEIKYHFLNSQKELLYSGAFFCQSKISEYLDPKSGNITTGGFYLDSPDLPADTRSTLIHLASLEQKVASQVKWIRVELGRHDQSVKSVSIRFYQEEKESERELETVWTRQSLSRKTRLVRGNIYPETFLFPEEKLNAVRWSWRPTGPAGMQEADFKLKTLYQQRDIEGERIEPDSLPSSWYISDTIRATYPIPSAGETLRIRWIPWGDAPGEEDKIFVLWDGKGKRKEWTLSHSQNEMTLEEHFEEGILEFATRTGKTFSGQFQRQTQSGDWEDVGPYSILSRAFLSDDQFPLSYKVHHVNHGVTPFRIDVRFLLRMDSVEPDQAVFNSWINFEWFNNNNERLGSAIREVNPLISQYDSAPGSDPSIKLSERERFYFNFPGEVSEVRVQTKSPAWITAFNRPSDAKRIIRIPEDYDRANTMERSKTWFYIRPIELHSLYENQRTGLIRLQLRPREDDPVLIAGDYDWLAYLPEGQSWVGKNLLSPRAPDVLTRNEALKSIYRSTPFFQKLALNIDAASEISWTQPRAVFLNNIKGKPIEFEIWQNNQLIDRQTWKSQQGEWRLPWVSTGPGEFEFRAKGEAADKVSLLINSIENPLPGFIKRFAVQLKDEPLVFDYEKVSSDDETFSLMFFSELAENMSMTEPTALLIKVATTAPRPVGPDDNYTIPLLQFEIQPNQERNIQVLGEESKMISDGHTLFIPLQGDLEPGKYEVRIEKLSGPSGLLSMYRIAKGKTEPPTWLVGPVEKSKNSN